MTYSQHYCTGCRKYFNADMTDLADPGSHYTRRVIDTAVRLVVEDGLPYRVASWSLWRDHRVFVPYATIQNWPRRASREAALVRIRPVLMTALTAGIGFLPMATSTTPGAEIQRPPATVVIGGLVTSTLLTILVLPAIYSWFVPQHDPAEPQS